MEFAVRAHVEVEPLDEFAAGPVAAHVSSVPRLAGCKAMPPIGPAPTRMRIRTHRLVSASILCPSRVSIAGPSWP